MTDPVVVDLRTELAAPAGPVWARVSTMAGVNAELAPWVRMTHLPHLTDLRAAPEGLVGTVAFRSWLLALGVVPFDRHALRLLEVDDQGLAGGGFVEDSTSWLQRRWRHERSVEPRPHGGSAVTDHLVIEPRLALARPLVARLVPWLFARRHRRLVERFGAVGPSADGPVPSEP